MRDSVCKQEPGDLDYARPSNNCPPTFGQRQIMSKIFKTKFDQKIFLVNLAIFCVFLRFFAIFFFFNFPRSATLFSFSQFPQKIIITTSSLRLFLCFSTRCQHLIFSSRYKSDIQLKIQVAPVNIFCSKMSRCALAMPRDKLLPSFYVGSDAYEC